MAGKGKSFGASMADRDMSAEAAVDYMDGHRPKAPVRRPPSPDLDEVKELLEMCTASADGALPMVPDEVTRYLLERSGCQTDDDRVVRMVSLAAQHALGKMVSDSLATQAYLADGHKSKSGDVLLRTEAVSTSMEFHDGIRGTVASYLADSRDAGL